MKTKKNIAESIFDEKKIGEDFWLLFHENNSDKTLTGTRETKPECMQFHFCLKGNMKLGFNQGRYFRELEKEESMVLYNPADPLPISIISEPETIWVGILIPIEKLHALFSKEAHFIAFLNEDNRDKKYYQEHHITPSMIMVLNQMLSENLNPVVSQLYYRAKCFELFSFYFNGPRDIDIDQCPFLVDEKNVAKIRLAKEIIIQKMAEPPTLQQLADEIQLPINCLKQGFKQVYGDTVFGFLLDYKLEKAVQLLKEGSMNVNEVSLQLGYSAASHFISAFKKKYGTTPKKYMMSAAKAHF